MNVYICTCSSHKIVKNDHSSGHFLLLYLILFIIATVIIKLYMFLGAI